jgi:hypothetical protein
MRITEIELVNIWRYFQYCCLPSIIMAHYAYLDSIDKIKEDKVFYRHEAKRDLNKIGKILESLPNKLMDVGSEYVRYMNILGDNIEEQFEEENAELYKGIYLTFRNAKMKHLDCLASLHYVSVMLQIASVIFTQCCEDMRDIIHKDPTELFHTYNLRDITIKWNELVDKAAEVFGYNKVSKKVSTANLNNPRCTMAVEAIRKKYTDVETLRVAMKKSYPWSPNYREGVPYEQSADYLIVNTKVE